MAERHGIVTFQGQPLTLIGPDLREGSEVPAFSLLGPDLSLVSWADLKGSTLLFNVVPSLDTEVCTLQTKRFNEELRKLSPKVDMITVSADLPFAQSRFAAAERIQFRILSDHRDFSFAHAFGVGIKELRLLARAVFVVDPGGHVAYREIVPELSSHPHYETALRALR